MPQAMNLRVVRQRERRAADPVATKEYLRAWNLKAKYGLTVEDFDRLLAEQGGVCAICKRPEERLVSRNRWGEYTRSSFTVDHNHATEAVRGILCIACNALLGQARDSEQTLQAAISYLKNSEVES